MGQAAGSACCAQGTYGPPGLTGTLVLDNHHEEGDPKHNFVYNVSAVEKSKPTLGGLWKVAIAGTVVVMIVLCLIFVGLYLKLRRDDQCRVGRVIRQNFQVSPSSTQCEDVNPYPMAVLSAEKNQPYGNALYLIQAGTVLGLGKNNHGELCNITGLTASCSGGRSALSGQVMQVAMGSGFALYLTDDKKVYAAGVNRYCMLEDTQPCDQDITLTQVKLPGKVVAIAAGEDHALFLMDDGSVIGTGGNADVQSLGRTGAVNVTSNFTVFNACQSIGATANASFCILGDGNVKMTGSLVSFTRQGEDELAEEPYSDPTPINFTGANFSLANPQVSYVIGGPLANTVLFIHADGSVTGMGRNINGQLGTNDTSPRANGNLAKLPVTNCIGAAIGKEWSTEMVYGSNYEFILLVTQVDSSDTDIFAAGSNAHHQLADLAQPNREIALVSKMDAFDIRAVAAGMSAAIYISKENQIFVGGSNSGGELSLPGIQGVELDPSDPNNSYRYPMGTSSACAGPPTLYMFVLLLPFFFPGRLWY